ncbi:hypothetical protein D3C83_311940 [compost metagenome]
MSICQDWAAPLEMTPMTFSMSRPAFLPKLIASDRPCRMPTMATWLTILVSWPAPGAPIRAHILA